MMKKQKIVAGWKLHTKNDQKKQQKCFNHAINGLWGIFKKKSNGCFSKKKKIKNQNYKKKLNKNQFFLKRRKYSYFKYLSLHIGIRFLLKPLNDSKQESNVLSKTSSMLSLFSTNFRPLTLFLVFFKVFNFIF